jgi:pyruvate, water dikinase
VARFLTGIGIDSISVNPSSLLRTMAVVNEAEAWKGRARALENT